MTKIFTFFALVLSLSISSIVWANKTLDAFYQNTQSLQADFQQTVRSTRGRVLERSQGLLILNRPDKFILEYTSPAEQKYISNGKTIWIYDVELEQVSIKNLDEGIGDSPALLLSSNKNIYRQYDVSDITSARTDGLSWIQLQAKSPEMTFERVLLAFKGSTLKTMIMHDSFGQITELNFSRIKVNKPFANRQFNFTIPDNVDVIGVPSAD